MNRKFGGSLKKIYDLLQHNPPDHAGNRLHDAYHKGLRCFALTRPDLHPPKESPAYAAWCAGWDAAGERSIAARALRAIPSERRAAASRANGRKGGRPRKEKKE
jgi:hypothetical protein